MPFSRWETYSKRLLNPIAALQNEEGNLILALAFSLIVLVATIFSTMTVSNNSIHTQTSLLSVESNLMAFEYDLIAHLQNPVIWNQIVASSGNGNLARCFSDPTYDCPNETHPLVVLKANGDVFYDSTNPLYGVTRFGTVCDKYAAADAPECVYAFAVSWAPRCDALTANCQAVPISITISMIPPNSQGSRVHTKDAKLQINPAHYSSVFMMN